jgi:hypothetical protein
MIEQIAHESQARHRIDERAATGRTRPRAPGPRVLRRTRRRPGPAADLG